MTRSSVTRRRLATRRQPVFRTRRLHQLRDDESLREVDFHKRREHRMAELRKRAHLAGKRGNGG